MNKIYLQIVLYNYLSTNGRYLQCFYYHYIRGITLSELFLGRSTKKYKSRVIIETIW